MTKEPQKATKRRHHPSTPMKETPLLYELPVLHRSRTYVDLRSLTHDQIALEAAQLIKLEFHRDTWCRSRGNIVPLLLALKYFDRFLTEETSRGSRSTIHMTSFKDVTVQIIDAFDRWLLTEKKSETRNRARMMNLFVQFLRAFFQNDDLTVEMHDRLMFGSHVPVSVSHSPREPFSPFELENLRKAAQRDVDTINLKAQRASAACDIGGNNNSPLAPYHWQWRAKHEGFYAVYVKKFGVVLDRLRYKRPERTDLTVFNIFDGLYPTQDDVIGFLILLAETTGIPSECVFDLKCDCLGTEKDGFVELTYTKRRSVNAPKKKILVSTEGKYSAPNLINQVLELTALTRKHIASEFKDYLFIGRNASRLGRLDPARRACAAFVEKYALKSDNGDIFVLRMSHIRKNVEAHRYVQADGSLAAVSTDHTKEVAANHYCKIKALTEQHEKAIEDGLHHCFEAATTSKIQPFVSGDALPGNLNEAELPLAKCEDFYHRPDALPGEPCQDPIFGCLNCSNAIITYDRLPELLALLATLRAKMDELDINTWMWRCGEMYVRVQNILQHFPPDMIAQAREEAKEFLSRSWSVMTLATKV